MTDQDNSNQKSTSYSSQKHERCKNKACQNRCPYTNHLAACEEHYACAHPKNMAVDPSRDDPPKFEDLKTKGEKVIVTDYGLAHWLAQTFKLDVNEFPNMKPPHLSETAYNEIKQLLKDQNSQKGCPKTPSAQMIQQLMKQIGKEISLMSQNDRYKYEKEMQKLKRGRDKFDPNDTEWMKDPERLKPLVYELSKRVVPACYTLNYVPASTANKQSNPMPLSRKKTSMGLRRVQSRLTDVNIKDFSQSINFTAPKQRVSSIVVEQPRINVSIGLTTSQRDVLESASERLTNAERPTTSVKFRATTKLHENVNATIEPKREKTQHEYIQDRLNSKFIGNQLSRREIISAVKSRENPLTETQKKQLSEQIQQENDRKAANSARDHVKSSGEKATSKAKLTVYERRFQRKDLVMNKCVKPVCQGKQYSHEIEFKLTHCKSPHAKGAHTSRNTTTGFTSLQQPAYPTVQDLLLQSDGSPLRSSMQQPPLNEQPSLFMLNKQQAPPREGSTNLLLSKFIKQGGHHQQTGIQEFINEPKYKHRVQSARLSSATARFQDGNRRVSAFCVQEQSHNETFQKDSNHHYNIKRRYPDNNTAASTQQAQHEGQVHSVLSLRNIQPISSKCKSNLNQLIGSARASTARRVPPAQNATMTVDSSSQQTVSPRNFNSGRPMLNTELLNVPAQPTQLLTSREFSINAQQALQQQLATPKSQPDTIQVVSQHVLVQSGSGSSRQECKSQASSSGTFIAALPPTAFKVPTDDINFELPEPASYFQDSLQLSIQTMPAKQKKIGNIFEDAEFWFSKGHIIQTIGNFAAAPQQPDVKEPSQKENQIQVALDYYLSGVKIDPQHLGCIHNVGCCQFYTGKYANSEKWFNLAIRVQPLHQDSYIGSTMSSLKLGRYEQAMATIMALNQQTEWTSTSYKQEQAIFLQAICSRLLPPKQEPVQEPSPRHSAKPCPSQCSKTSEIYNKLHKGCRNRHNEHVKLLSCSLLLLPLEKSRQTIEDLITDYKEIVMLNDQSQYLDVNFEANKVQILKSHEPRKFMAAFIHRQPLFKRLRLQTIEKAIMAGDLEVETLHKGDVLHISGRQTPDSIVHVVVNGKIILRDHELNDPYQYNVLQVAKPGTILGVQKLDLGNSCRSTVWPIVQSQVAHVCSMPFHAFDAMWKESISLKQEIKIATVNQCKLFANVSDATQAKIMYNRGRLVTFQRNEHIIEWHRRSRWNTFQYQIYRDFKPIIATGANEESTNQNQPLEHAEILSGSNRKQAQQFDTMYLNLAKTVIKADKKDQFKLDIASIKQKFDETRQSSRTRALQGSSRDGLANVKHLPPSYPPMYILVSGQLSIWAYIQDEPHLVHKLTTGDAFGYSDLLLAAGPEYLGDIRVSQECEEAQCLEIDEPDQVFELYERKILREIVYNDYKVIRDMNEKKFPFLKAQTPVGPVGRSRVQF